MTETAKGSEERRKYLRRLAARLRDPEQYVDACDEAADLIDDLSRGGPESSAPQMTKPVKVGKVVWGFAPSGDSEEWQGHYSTREACVADALTTLSDLPVVWVVRGREIVPEDFVESFPGADANAFVEGLDEYVGEQVFADDVLFELRQGGKEALVQTLRSWVHAWVSPSGWWTTEGRPEMIHREGTA